MMSMMRDTAPHACEQLLVGWVTGAAQAQPQACSDEDEMVPQHPPPTAASPCSQGESGANDLLTTSMTETTSQ